MKDTLAYTNIDPDNIRPMTQMKSPTQFTTRYDELLHQFIETHKKHPDIWKTFCLMIRALLKKGIPHYGAGSLLGVIRYRTDIGELDSGKFKINSNTGPFYARAFHETYPELDGFFRERHQTSMEMPPVHAGPLSPGFFNND